MYPSPFRGAKTKYHRPGGLWTETYFSNSWSLRSPVSRCWQIRCLARTSLLVHRQVSSGCVLIWQKSQGNSEIFNKALIQFMRTLLSWSNHLKKAPLPKTITMGVTIQTYEFWEDTIIQSIAICQRHSKMCKKLNMNEAA